MKTELAVPLSITQIEAAQKIHQRLSQWKDTDDALLALRDLFPEFDIKATLLKVATVNQLYGTNVYAVDRMARHIIEVLNTRDNFEDIDIIEELAALPRRKHISFASKFAHFFINSQRFPIYDSASISMIKFHLGRGEWIKNNASEYQDFLQNFDALRERARPALSCDCEALDHYLWLTGLYKKEKTRAKLKDEDAPEINREVWKLFQDLSPGGISISPLVDMLPPEFANLKRRKPRAKKDKKQ
jgi:hypothetical protein